MVILFQPLSEIKKQLWNKVLKNEQFEQPNFNDSQEEAPNENVETQVFVISNSLKIFSCTLMYLVYKKITSKRR